MAAKKGIIWPLNTTIQAQTCLLATKQNLAESARINQFLAESANSLNEFHRPLMGSQHFTANGSIWNKADLSGKFRLGSMAEKPYPCRGGHFMLCVTISKSNSSSRPSSPPQRATRWRPLRRLGNACAGHAKSDQPRSSTCTWARHPGWKVCRPMNSW